MRLRHCCRATRFLLLVRRETMLTTFLKRADFALLSMFLPFLEPQLSPLFTPAVVAWLVQPSNQACECLRATHRRCHPGRADRREKTGPAGLTGRNVGTTVNVSFVCVHQRLAQARDTRRNLEPC